MSSAVVLERPTPVVVPKISGPVIIAGSRTLGPRYPETRPRKVVVAELEYIYKCIDRTQFDITEIVSGRAQGIDLAGETYAIEMGIPVKMFPADWNKHGRSAGMIRNAEMAAYAVAAIIIWDGVSKGTADMVSRMKVRDKPIEQYERTPYVGPVNVTVYNEERT